MLKVGGRSCGEAIFMRETNSFFENLLTQNFLCFQTLLLEGVAWIVKIESMVANALKMKFTCSSIVRCRRESGSLAYGALNGRHQAAMIFSLFLIVLPT